MITIDDVKQIISKIELENGMWDNDLNEDVSEIVYRTDVFILNDETVTDRHIDIEFSFGEFYEVHEDNPLFQYISALCSLPMAQEEEEIILYQNDR